MSTILEADATGTLHLPPSLLPHPGPGRRYRVAAAGGQVVVNEAAASQPEAGSREAWLKGTRAPPRPRGDGNGRHAVAGNPRRHARRALLNELLGHVGLGEPVFIRTNDALHIASAIAAGEAEFVTADIRQRAAARLMGLTVQP